MRPLKLILTAFGPYKDKEVIDFRQLKHNQLFVISGHTGSGKTTIFDGISFALYGTASGEDREDTALLRSHFADDDVHTAVELLFEINGKTYRVLRQLGHIKKGNKTKTGDNYEFFEVDGTEEVPMVDRQIVSEINREIEKLIGLTQSQFKQIVMLPQGEFRKLLTSETENKEEILRRLFQTDSYQELNEQLKQRRDLLKSDFEDLVRLRDHYVQLIKTTVEEREDAPILQVLNSEHYNINQVLTSLQEEIEYYKSLVKEKEFLFTKIDKQLESKHTLFYEAKSINERFTELSIKEEKLRSLNEGKLEIKKIEKRLELAEYAAEIEPIETQYNESILEEKKRKEQFNQANMKLEQAKREIKAAKEQYGEEKKNEDRREKLRKRGEELNSFLTVVEQVNVRREQLKIEHKTFKKNKAQVAKIDKEIKSMTEQLETYNERIIKYGNEVRVHGEKVNLRHQKRDEYRELNDYLKVSNEYIGLLKDYSFAEKQYEKVKQTYKKAEEVWFTDHAVLLAAQLNNNESCPVCGSLDHPDKARDHVHGITKEELDKLKRKFEREETRYKDLIASLRNSERQRKEKEVVLEKYGIGEEQITEHLKEIKEIGLKLSSDITSIEEKQKTLDRLQKEKAELEVKSRSLHERRDVIDQEVQTIRDHYLKHKAIYEEEIKKVPEKFQVLSVLRETIQAIDTEGAAMEKAWQEAEKNLQNARLNEAEKLSQFKSAKEELGKASSQGETLKDRFIKAVHSIHFTSIEQYKDAKLQTDKKQQLKERLEQFSVTLNSLVKDIANLKEFLLNKKEKDLNQLQKELNKLKQTYETTMKDLNETRSLVNTLKNNYKQIEEENKKVASYEKRLSIVTDLYDVIRGHNEKRISFERYLQIGYLEQIIDAANERLNKLSNGQFLLMRSERQESYGRQSGLALDIYDSYTGQARDVKSLSGGEKFNASLCLALGMSDVIQSFQGGISIETMFIDEGFGSLDEEALNKAIDTLIDLQQSGRMIGVISHVDQLKAIFPAVLEVKKIKEGYSETAFVIK